MPDPETEALNLELKKQRKEFDILRIAHEIQDVIIKQLEKKVIEKDEELSLNAKRKDEHSNYMLQMNEKLRVDLQTQVEQYKLMVNETTDLRKQLEASQVRNVEIANETETLKAFYREQVEQISHDLQLQRVNLAEQLDQFRSLLVAANTKLQVQRQDNEVIKSEHSSLRKQNAELSLKIYRLKVQKFRNISLFKDMQTQRRYRRVRSITKKPQTRNDLKIKLVKSTIHWKCVKC